MPKPKRDILRVLLASSSVAALLVGGGAPPALAASCTKLISASFDNPSGHTTANVCVKNTSFAGQITNEGTISPSGISFVNGTLTGYISSTGVIAGGISIDTASSISYSHFSSFAPATAINIITGTSFSGGITNAGSISVSGSFVYGIVANVSSFTGGITNTGLISAPGVYDGAGIVIYGSAFSGGVTNGGTITVSGSFNTSYGIDVQGTATFAGGITNGGTITASGGGSFGCGIAIFSVTNFTGGIVNQGTISASSNSSQCADGIYVSGVSSFSGGISNAGTISTNDTGIGIASDGTFTGGITNTGSIIAAYGIRINNVTTFSGNISNAGTITASTGIWIGSGVTFAAGSAIVNSGTIVGTVAAINAASATSPVTIDQTGGLISGAINLSANADVLNISGGTINGNIVGQGSSDTINFALGAGTFTYGSAYGFSNINQVNINSGTVILDGTNNATNVAVNGGTLAGTGTLDPLTLTIFSGGTFSPGTPGVPGTSMTITGNLVFKSGATYQIYLNPTATTYSTVSGSATLAGTVDVSFASGSYVAKKYTILTATGGLGGTTFSSLVNVGLPAGSTDHLSYDADDVYLNLTFGIVPPSYTPLNVNQTNVASTLINYFNTTGGIPTPFFTLSPNGLTQIDGEVATDAERGAFLLMDQFLELMLDPFVDGRSGAGWPFGGGTANSFAPDQQASFPPDIALAYDSVLKAPPPTFNQRWTAWGAGFGGSNTSNGNATIGSNNVTASDYGYAAGMDYHFNPDNVAGFALAGGGTNWTLTQGLGTGRSDDFQAGAYGVTRSGPFYLAGAVAFANHWMTTNRIALGDQLQASFNAQSYGARIEGGYRYGWMTSGGAAGVTPYAAIQPQFFHTPAYSETDLTGGGFGLNYAAMNSTDTRSELGARFDDTSIFGTIPLTLRARVAWAHDWVSNPALAAAFQTLPGTSFIVNGAPIPKDSALASVGAVLHVTTAWSFAAKFDGQFAQGSETYAGTGTLRYQW